MSKVREATISNCEKKFVLKSLKEWNRLDGRAFDEFRHLHIEFGKDWGCCHVTLGETRVLAQVSCEVQQPKSSRPSEGILNINLELNPLGAPHFEAGRQSELSVQLNRLLEKCLKDSKAVDLESLCIKVNEKVWAFRVDINVLNHEGNILDAASIAALCALAHFRRPDVTCDGEEVVVHTYAQRDPIPTVIHHYPICISFAVFNNGETVLADPTLLEETVAEAYLTVGLNAYKELCALHLGGSALVTIDLILSTTAKAATRASIVIKQIKQLTEEGSNKRLQKKDNGFHHSLYAIDEDFKAAQEKLSSCLDTWSIAQKGKRKHAKKDIKMVVSDSVEPVGTVETLGQGSAVLVPQDDGDQESQWRVSSDEESEPEIIADVKAEPANEEQETLYKYDETVENSIYKDLLQFSVNIEGIEYPLMQQLGETKYCLACENSFRGTPQRHLKSHTKYRLKSPDILASIKVFHDMWMSQPVHIQQEQIYFRKRNTKITCTVCSNSVLYYKHLLDEHVQSVQHKFFVLKEIDRNKSKKNGEVNKGKSVVIKPVAKDEQLKNNSDYQPDAACVDLSGSEEESVVVLNADRQTSKKKRKFTN